MSHGDEELSNFEDLKRAIDSDGQALRQRALDELIRRYRPRIEHLVHSIFFPILRPSVTTLDVASRVLEKLRKRLEERKIRLETEAAFFRLAKKTALWTMMDMNGTNRLQAMPLDQETHGGGTIAARIPDGNGTPSEVVGQAELLAAFRDKLRQILQPDDFYLVRRFHLDLAEAGEIAAELTAMDGRERTAGSIRARLSVIRAELAQHPEMAAFRPMLDGAK